MREPVDILITDALVVTMDRERRVLPGAGIAIAGGSIRAIGDSAELSSRFDAAERLEARGRLVMPGLINTHVHLATVMFRGLAEDLPLAPWLRKVWSYERAVVNPETVALASRLAMMESLLGGVTCGVDMYWFPEATAETAKKLGFRLVNGPVFIAGDDHPDGLSLRDREEGARRFLERYDRDPLIEPMLMPHSTFTDSPELLRRVKRLADASGRMVNLHAAETEAERREVQAREGRTPIALLADLGFLDGRTLLAHCVHVDEEEIRLLAGGAAVAHNPLSNLKLASGIAPLAKMAEAGVRLSLGTDGAQSGNDLNLWLAMRLAALLQKCATGDPSRFRAEEIVAMATIEAARAIGLGDRIGSLEPGKRADLIILDLEAPHLVPMFDVYAELVYALGREDVATVLVEGRVLVRDRKALTVDLGECLEAVRRIAAAMPALPREEG